MPRGSDSDSGVGTGVRPTPYARDQVLEFPEMSFTVVTSNREMAGSFSRYLLAAASKMVPRDWTVKDLVDVLAFVLEGGDEPVQFIEGRYLRKRVREQVARAERYEEPFSMMIIVFGKGIAGETYESLVDVLTERLRRSDMVFLYKHRIVILLPHTPASVIGRLQNRITKLAAATIGIDDLDFTTASYPGERFSRSEEVLDWVEDQLR